MTDFFPRHHAEPVLRPCLTATMPPMNWLKLKRILGAEKERLLQEVDNAVRSPESAKLRPSWQRGL